MATQTEQRIVLTLRNEEDFDFISGLWAGKKPPFTKAVVIRNTNFSNDGKIDYSNIAVLDVEAKQLQTRKLRKGDIIIERSGGGPKQPVGRVVYFDKETPEIPYSFSNFTSAIRVKNQDNFDSRYVFYFLHNFYIEGNTDHLQRRTTGIRNLDFSSYKESVVFPPIPVTEQKAIVRVLTTLQDAIAEQENLIVKLKELKRSMMQHLFTHGTQGEVTKMTEIGEMPESWKLVRLGEACDVLASSITFKQAEVKTGDSMVLGVKVSDMNIPGNEKYLKTSGTTFYFSDTKRLVPPGAIVFPKRGAAIATNKKRMSVSYSLLDPNLIAIVPKQDLLPDFIFSFFEMFNLSTLTDPGTIPQLNKKDLAPVLLPLPSRGEQEKIITAIQAVDAGVESARSKLASYQSLFKTLLHELMSGARRINT